MFHGKRIKMTKIKFKIKKLQSLMFNTLKSKNKLQRNIIFSVALCHYNCISILKYMEYIFHKTMV